MPTTTQGPMTVEDLIKALQLLPLDWRIRVANSDGEFYVTALTLNGDTCIADLDLEEIP